MKLIFVILTSISSFVVLFFLTKLIGSKQLSELNMFEYIIGITIGSIAAEMATNIEGDFWLPLTAMIIYAGFAILISFISNRTIKFRRFMEGCSMILMDNGKIYKHNFSKASLDLDSFLTLCRNQGYFNLSDIQTAILENNGKISILPKDNARPVTPKDMKIKVDQQHILSTYIIDGYVLEENLKQTGKNKKWLFNQLEEQKTKLEDVFLATDSGNNQLKIFTKADNAPTKDLFQ